MQAMEGDGASFLPSVLPFHFSAISPTVIRVCFLPQEASAADVASGAPGFTSLNKFHCFIVSSTHKGCLLRPPHSRLLPRACTLQAADLKSEAQSVWTQN